LVYCTKCGTENEEDAEVCKNCGASLRPPAYRTSRRRDWDFDDECFGGRNRMTWPLLIGAFLILMGLSTLLEGIIPTWDVLWPLFIIAIGVLIVRNAYNRR